MHIVVTCEYILCKVIMVVVNHFICNRLVILECHVIWKIHTIIAQQVESFLLSGQLQRLRFMGSTRVPVMCGATAVWCMKYGVWEENYLQIYSMKRLRSMTYCVLPSNTVYPNEY